jgi:hypothetical protein
MKPYYFYRKGREFGPFSAADLKKLKERGELQPEDLVWTPGMSGSVPAEKVEGLYCPAGTAGLLSVAVSPPPICKKIPLLPPPLPVARLGKSLPWVLLQKIWILGRRASYEICVTVQAFFLQIIELLEYLIAKTQPTDRQAVPISIDPITRIRASVGGILLLCVTAALSSNPEPEEPYAAQGGPTLAVAAEQTPRDNGQPADTKAIAAKDDKPEEIAERQPEPEETEKLAKTEDSEASTPGMRVPVRVPAATFSRFASQRPGSGYRFKLPSYRAPQVNTQYDVQADYQRQQAIMNAQEASRRAMRDFQYQTSGNLGAQGLMWVPSGN